MSESTHPLDRTIYLGKNLAFLRENFAKTVRNVPPGEKSVRAESRRASIMSQAELSEVIGYKQSHVGNMESGRVLGSLIAIGRIANFFGVTIDDLLYVDLEAVRYETVTA